MTSCTRCGSSRTEPVMTAEDGSLVFSCLACREESERLLPFVRTRDSLFIVRAAAGGSPERREERWMGKGREPKSKDPLIQRPARA